MSKGIAFRCQECRGEVTIVALVLLEGDVYLLGNCTECEEQMKFRLAECLMNMLPQPAISKAVN